MARRDALQLERVVQPACDALDLVNRSGNRPSAERAAERYDQARMLCREAGFQRITFRGDTDFSQTALHRRRNRCGRATRCDEKDSALFLDEDPQGRYVRA